RYRYRAELRWWGMAAGICFVTALVMALPFIVYVSNPGAYYWSHIDDYRSTGVLRSPEYRNASTGGKVKIVAEQVRDFFATYGRTAQPDIVDANGLRRMSDPLTLLLWIAALQIA